MTGFSLEYEGLEDIKINSPNLRLEVGSETTLWNKVMKEMKLKRNAGPFSTIPFDNYIQSPIGLVPKDECDTRLIFHLSYPRGTGKSVNANTPVEKSTVKYPDFNEAIQLCIREGWKCRLGSSDMRSAFRNLRILRLHWRFLIMTARSPLDGKTYYFVDKCLPFGASISCSHFQKFSDAVAHLVKFRTGRDLVNYLNDFLFIALMKMICNSQIKTFLEVCAAIHFPISLEKTFWATTCIVFLGMLIDMVTQTVSIPVEKIEHAIQLLNKILDKKGAKCKVTLKQLQKLCGFLNFLCRSIVPRRAFTRRLYAYTASPGKKLLPHHHIRVNNEMRRDMMTWKQFLLKPQAYCCLFIDFSKTLVATEIGMFSDASRSDALGFGVICNSSWMYRMWRWDPELMEKYKPSIASLELYAVTAGILSGIQRFQNQQIILFCSS